MDRYSQTFSNNNVNLTNEAFTLSAWGYQTNAVNYNGINEIFGGGDLGAGMQWGSGTALITFGFPGDSIQSTAIYAGDTGNWHYYAYELNSSHIKSFYRDGVGINIQAGNQQNFLDTKGLVIGSGWQGSLDEARAEGGVARSTNWIWACYMTMASNSMFCTYTNLSLSTGIAPSASSGWLFEIL
jgi:hypothetical protein